MVFAYFYSMKTSFRFLAAIFVVGLSLVLQSNACKPKKDTSQQEASTDMDRMMDSLMAAMRIDSMKQADSMVIVFARQRYMDSTRLADSLAQVNNQQRPHPPALPLEPTYKEGRAALEKFLADNTKYPEAARSKGIKGFVIVGFLVMPNGSLSGFKVLKSLGYGCDEEALRVAQLMPPWNPGKQNGKVVAMEYNVSVKFGMK